MAFDYLADENPPTATANLESLIETEMASIPMTKGEAWDLLAAGRSNEAINSFVANIDSDSGSGAAKLGYGLAYAEIGNFQKAAWAIRRAFEIDPDGVSDIMLDGKLRPTLQKITDKFENDEPMPLDKDSSLVLGTLYQLMGDIEMAQVVIDKVQHDPSMYLVSMIKEENKMEKEMTEEAIPKLEKMDEIELVAFGPKLSPVKGSESLPVYGPEPAPVFYGPELPPNFDTIEKALPLDSVTQIEPLLLEGPTDTTQ